MKVTETNRLCAGAAYADLLTALCRAAQSQPLAERATVLRGVARSLSHNFEPERSGFVQSVMRGLATAESVELARMIQPGICGGLRSPRGLRLVTSTPARIDTRTAKAERRASPRC